MICKKCNHKLPDDSEFCQYCGSKVENIETAKNDLVEDNAAELIDKLSNPDMTSKDALNAILQFQAKATIDAMEANANSQPDNEGDDDFGLVPEKPIFTHALKSVDGEKEYLNNLYTVNGEKIKYTRRGSTSVEGINGMIDIYNTFLPSGQPYKTIYINMYGATASTVAPYGFVLVEKKYSGTADTHTDDNKKEVSTKRYCTHCGSPINEDTKRCMGCGKQYFKGIKHFLGNIFCKRHLALVIVSFVLLASLIANIVLAINVADLERAYHINRDKVDQYEKDLSDVRNKVEQYKDELSNVRNKVNFIDNNVVFIEDDGSNLYHKYDCYKFKGYSYWVHNVEYAVYRGYKPCSTCCD